MRNRNTFLTLALLAAAMMGIASNASAVQIQAGDAIKLDFSLAGDGDGGNLADWNQFGALGGAADNIAAGNVKRHGGGTFDNVSINFANAIAGRVNNDGNSANWGGTAGDQYYELGTDDIYFHGSATDLQVTLGGLDTSLDYNVRIYSLINNSNTTDRFVVSDGTGTLTAQNTRSFRFNAPTLEGAGTVFNGVSLNASNELVVSVENVGSAFYPLNALVIEAADPVKGSDVWQVDVNGTGNPQVMSGRGFLGGGDVWNDFRVNHHAGTSVNPSANLNDSDGNATGVTFNVQGTVSGFNNAGPDPVRADYLFVNAGGASANIDWSLEGLSSGQTYELFAYAGGIGGRDFNMLIDTNGDGDLGDETAFNVAFGGRLFEELIASSNGSIIGQILNDGHEGNFAGFELRQVSQAVPEPTTATLGLIGLAGLMVRRRRAA